MQSMASWVTIKHYSADQRPSSEYVKGGQNVFVYFPPKLAGFFELLLETSDMAVQWAFDAKRR